VKAPGKKHMGNNLAIFLSMLMFSAPILRSGRVQRWLARAGSALGTEAM